VNADGDAAAGGVSWGGVGDAAVAGAATTAGLLSLPSPLELFDVTEFSGCVDVVVATSSYSFFASVASFSVMFIAASSFATASGDDEGGSMLTEC